MPRRGMRRRRPILRTAVVGGAGYAAGKKRSKDQQTAEAAAVPAATPPAQAISGTDRIEQLKQLAGLRDSGVLTEEEFKREKQKILGS